MAASADKALPLRLPELFEAGRRLLEQAEAAAEPSGSQAVQDAVAEGLELLGKAADMLSLLDLFSRNEDVEDIASADLKYLLLPALQGALTVKQVRPGERLAHLQQAREHFLNYLTQCRHYRLAEFPLPGTRAGAAQRSAAAPAAARPGLEAMASQREAKIERYRQRKEAESRLAALKRAVESGQAADERVREYHLLHLRRWAGISLDEIESIDQEMEILREKDSAGEAAAPPASRQERPPVKPFILTRNVTQAKVFGAGYPSLATMTVNDWYEQHQKFGALPDQGIAKETPEPSDTES
nr:immunoglobulin-binding protein 1 [Oryctolagus cuniculus]